MSNNGKFSLFRRVITEGVIYCIIKNESIAHLSGINPDKTVGFKIRGSEMSRLSEITVRNGEMWKDRGSSRKEFEDLMKLIAVGNVIDS